MKTANQHRTIPAIKASWISKISYWWVMPLVSLSNRKQLDVSDLYDVIPDASSKVLGDKLSKAWECEIKLSERRNGSPSLRKALFQTFRTELMLGFIVATLNESVSRAVLAPAIALLLGYFGGDLDEASGIIGGLIIVIASFAYAVLYHWTSYTFETLAIKMRIALTVLLYKKVFRISSYALQTSSIGQMTNLLSNDVNRFERNLLLTSYVVFSPVQGIVLMAVLYYYIGISVLAGAALLVIMVPIQFGIGKLTGILRVKAALKTDFRVRLINEMISGNQLIKMCTWENLFSEIIRDARKEEIRAIHKKWSLEGINRGIFQAYSKLLILALFGVFLVLGNVLTPIKAFILVTMLTYVRQNFTLCLPIGVAGLTEILISISRIQDFMNLDEHNTEFKRKQSITKALGIIGVEAKNITATWAKPLSNTDERMALTQVSLTVGPHELIGIIGPVGCGKSTLAQVLIGELQPNSGTIKSNGKVAYVPQNPWLFPGSLRENILLDKEYNPKKFNEIVRVCGLERDLTLLSHGDQTMIGDRGITLSGGQKSRVSLARAVYCDADIYILDDPLSALDAKVGQEVLNNCICGYLKEKCVVLVSSQIQYLEQATEILAMENGTVVCRGTYSELLGNKDLSLGSLKTLGPSIDEISLEILREPIKGPDNVKSSDSKIYGTFIDGKTEKQSEIGESRSYDSIGFSLYWKYLQAGSGIVMLLATGFFQLLCQALLTFTDYWIKVWTFVDTEKSNTTIGFDNATSNFSYEEENHNDFYYFIIYVIITGAVFVAAQIKPILFYKLCMKNSSALHDKIFRAVLRAPIRFFEINSYGRIFNRFVNDIGTVDEFLPRLLDTTLMLGLQILGFFILIILVSPVLLIPTVILLFLLYLLRKYYVKCSANLKRIESVARSPVFGQVTTTLYGLSTIRTFEAEKHFLDEFFTIQDSHTSPCYLYYSVGRWLEALTEYLTDLYILCVLISCAVFVQDASSVGLAISSALSLTVTFPYGMHVAAELHNQLVAVERINEYSNIKPEAPLRKAGGHLPKNWPSQGKIQMDNLVVSYGADAKVLHNLSLLIKPMAKIGIVGRTGAGKTTLISCLFRLVEAKSGTIHIDGIDAKKLGLHDLREKMSIIPQNPILFIGTIRRNLDPFNLHSDVEIWNALEEVHLLERVKSSSAGLDGMVFEHGANFSQGEKQLLCLARAILCKHRILVLDEATASVDSKTDGLIQNTIRQKFSHCTILTIAHRLHTVMDSDKICVMEAGEIVEYDSPYNLMKNKAGKLYNLAIRTGEESFRNLYAIAEAAALAKTQ